ncbi:MAG: Uma2 family endonuclease [Chloroflexi bacterium]|nr:Uma2 family endonuclease [Chloroflexota bacterium]
MLTVPSPAIGLRSLDAGWNRARWEQLPADGKRYEVVDGVLYVSTVPSTFHQWVLSHIAFMLFDRIDRQNLGLMLWAPLPVFMPGCDPVQPDILVVRTEHVAIFHDRYVHGVPDLLVEVLSPSNAAQDTQVKRGAYARAGVPEYWIARPATRDLLVYAQPDKDLGDYAASTLVPPDGELVSATFPVRAAITGFFDGAPDPTL